MTLLYFICLGIIGVYVLLIFSFVVGFDLLKINHQTSEKKTHFSIIIPFRNEAEFLPELLNSITKLNYPKNTFEILFVDDDSSDNSVSILNTFCTVNPQINIQLIPNNRISNSPKKDAITAAIHLAQHQWIICTDADCILPNQWLETYSNFIESFNPNMVVAPVNFVSKSSFLAQFQTIDFYSMQGTTIGSFGMQYPIMANGANLAYKKEVFNQLNGFENNNFITSGDDVFLLENFLNHNPKKVLFLKDYAACVSTYPVKTWNTLIQQRKRWAAKATHFSNTYTQLIGLLVFITNGICILALFAAFFNPRYIWLFCLKFIIDTVLIFKTVGFFQQKINLFSYLKTLLFYPFFTFYIATISMFGSFLWKDRAFKK